jgi:aspartate kinase
MTWDGKITTLGRGGSDTTAVELGGYLQAERVDIFTDVPGVAIVDPRLVPDAAYIENISYAEMYQLASHGAKVIHPRAVKAAERFQVPVRVRSTFSEAPGTLISTTSYFPYKKIFGLPLDKEISYVKVGRELGRLPDFGKNDVVIYKTRENSYDIYLRKDRAQTFLAKFGHSTYEYNEGIERLSVFFHPENRDEIAPKIEEYVTRHASHVQDIFWFENHAALFMEHDKAKAMAQDLYHLL